jgi:hypothetical protein
MEIFLLTFPGFREGEKIGTKPQMRKIVEMPLTDTYEGTLDLFTLNGFLTLSESGSQLFKAAIISDDDIMITFLMYSGSGLM